MEFEKKRICMASSPMNLCLQICFHGSSLVHENLTRVHFEAFLFLQAESSQDTMVRKSIWRSSPLSSSSEYQWCKPAAAIPLSSYSFCKALHCQELLQSSIERNHRHFRFVKKTHVKYDKRSIEPPSPSAWTEHQLSWCNHLSVSVNHSVH